MKKIKIVISYIFTVITIWVAISTFVQAFKCPSMSQTELFINIPKSFVCDWNNCN